MRNRAMSDSWLYCIGVFLVVGCSPAPSGNGPDGVGQASTVEVIRDQFEDGSGQGPEMVVLPSGSFALGDAPVSGGSGEPAPRPLVAIDYAVAIGRYEVTFAEWDACVADGGCGAHAPSDQTWGRGSQPAINVSWEDAQSFIDWLNRKLGLTGSPFRYRLPSEAEWEYAARAGTTTNFSFGDEASQLRAYSWFAENSNGRSHPVGRKRPNAFGLHDVHGNVSEWVEDCWNEIRFGETQIGAPTDGSARTSGDCSMRFTRSGSWGDNPAFVRSAARGLYPYSPDTRVDYIGFRVARTLPN